MTPWQGSLTATQTAAHVVPVGQVVPASARQGSGWHELARQTWPAGQVSGHPVAAGAPAIPPTPAAPAVPPEPEPARRVAPVPVAVPPSGETSADGVQLQPVASPAHRNRDANARVVLVMRAPGDNGAPSIGTPEQRTGNPSVRDAAGLRRLKLRSSCTLLVTSYVELRALRVLLLRPHQRRFSDACVLANGASGASGISANRSHVDPVRILKRFWRGWAVGALFGRNNKGEQFLLPLVTLAAVAWPVLLMGIAAPKLAVQTIALIPLPDSVPSMDVRFVWVALAVLIPLGLGLMVAIRAVPRSHAPFVMRVLRGFPITVGLSAAFAIIFVSVPLMRAIALVRRQKTADVPLIMDAAAYEDVTAKVRDVLERHGFQVACRKPPWWVAAPVHLLRKTGGQALASHLPRRLEHLESDGLIISLYPSGIILRGKPGRLTWAHGLIAEAVVYTDGLQTTDPKARAVEQRLRPLWKRHQSADAQPTDAELEREIAPIARELSTLQVDWDDWQILYRQILQLDRALAGRRQLLDLEAPAAARQPIAS